MAKAFDGVNHETLLANPGPLMFIIYINYLSLRINSVSEPFLFANSTSVII
jgi:hypothetical protein